MNTLTGGYLKYAVLIASTQHPHHLTSGRPLPRFMVAARLADAVPFESALIKSMLSNETRLPARCSLPSSFFMV